MKLIAACLISVAALFAAQQQFTMAAVAAANNNNVAPVGLYAPDRYDGIPEMCLMPMDFGYCRAKVKRYYFDMRRMKCAMFYWGGCAGNINNFKSLDECNKNCIDSIYDDLNDNNDNDNSENSRNYINNNNKKFNYKNYNNNNNSNNNNNNSTNNKNDYRRLNTESPRNIDKNDNFEADESDYSNN